MRKKILTTFIIIVALATTSYAALITKFTRQANRTTLLSTELNSKGNNTCTAAGSIVDFSLVAAGGNADRDGYIFCSIEAVVGFPSAPAANSGLEVYFLRADDGTNYEDTPDCSSKVLGRRPNVVLGFTTGQTSTRISVDALCPIGKVKAMAKNAGSTQTTNASGNTVIATPYTLKSFVAP